MEALASRLDTDSATATDTQRVGWGRVLRDVLTFQFKLVVDGLKDLGLAQVALGAALLDLIRRDGTPGRRFYGIVQVSERFDTWLDLHEALARVPTDAPHYAPTVSRSVDDLIDDIECSARIVARKTADVTTRTRHGQARRMSVGAFESA